MKFDFYCKNLLFIVFLFFLKGCREDLDFTIANNKLKLSNDTIFFDTILTNTKSQVYRLKLYNLEKEAIEIPSISLTNGASSFFNIYVNGKKGPFVTNTPLRKNDSLYVLIELLPKVISNNLVYSDDILIETKSGIQKVHLKSFVEKAVYFNPLLNETEYIIENNTVWDNSLVYHINKSLKIANNSTLTIEAGTKVYFNKNSELIISEGSSLFVNGTVADKVNFRTNVHTYPLDVLYDQWNTIKLEKGSVGVIKNAIIKGGKNGLIIDEANVKLENVQIYNQSFNGISASNSIIEGKNVVINNCGNTSLKIERGGSYEFYHCTFANYSNFSNVEPLALSITNKGIPDNKPLTRCFFGNCIFTGLSNNSIQIDKNFDSNLEFTYFFDNNLIKFKDNTLELINNPNFSLSIFNQDPGFIDVSFKVNNLSLNASSFPRGKGLKVYSDLVNKNIVGTERIHPSNLGAY